MREQPHETHRMKKMYRAWSAGGDSIYGIYRSDRLR